jgi:hypothetical protein
LDYRYIVEKIKNQHKIIWKNIPILTDSLEITAQKKVPLPLVDNTTANQNESDQGWKHVVGRTNDQGLEGARLIASQKQ